MSLLLQQNITAQTKIAVWKIEEDEHFFLEKVQLQQTIHHPHKRLQHLAGRYLLSLLFPGFPYEEMKLNEAGKPYLPSHQYHFSISHCGDYAAVIISIEKQCGIDIELFSSKTEKVKFKYLSNDELMQVTALEEAQTHLFTNYQIYTLCWCAKEAVYKWWGNGKVDFRKNIVITNIDIDEQNMTVYFTKDTTETTLILSMIILQTMSVVWTIT